MSLNEIFENKSESFRLLFFFFILFIFSVLGLLVGMSVLSEDIILSEDQILDQKIIFQMKISQIITSVFIFIIPPIFFTFLEGSGTLKRIGFINNFNRQIILLVLCMICLFQPFISYTIQLNTDLIMQLPESFHSIKNYIIIMEEQAIKVTQAFLEMETLSDLIFNLFLIALLPAIGEEMLFRGVIQQRLKNIIGSPHISILITSFLFSLIHMQFFGFIPRFLLGALLGYLFYYSRNLWMPVIAHFMNNAIYVFLMYPFIAEKLNFDITAEDIQDTSISTALFSLLAGLMLLYLYKKILKRSN